MTTTHANLVIIGAGVVGCSAAYHLAKLGWRDILVLDKGELIKNDGSTSHAPGGMHVTNSSRMMTKFATYSVEEYAKLDPIEEGRPPLRPVGGIEVAYTRERHEDLKRKHGLATSWDVEAHLLTPQEVAQHIPFINTDVIHSGFYVPGDANALTQHLMAALIRDVEATGAAKFQGNTPITDLEVEGGRVRAVITATGRITCDHVLICTNIWSPILSERLGFTIPLMAAQHQYTVTTPLEPLKGETREIVHPILRHQDFSLYFRQHWDSYGIGNYRHEPLMVHPHNVGKTAMRDFTPEHFEIAWNAARELLPPIEQAELKTKFNGMFAFSVDGMPVMGESPVKGAWVAVGVWVTHSGGVGKAIAEWMTDGKPQMDLREADINRFVPHQLTPKYVRLRTAQNYREVYDIIHPLQQMEDPRGVRLAPYHQRLVENGGHFFQSAGYEVAQWYAGNAPLVEQYDDQIPHRDDWASRDWSRIQGAEHLAAREHVGLFNLAALSVIEISGPGAEDYLNHIAANRMNKPVGKVVYTSILDEAAGIYADVTVFRKTEDTFWMVTGGGLLPHDLHWVKKHAPTDGSVHVTDLSSAYVTIGLWGPKAREVMAAVADDYSASDTFKYYTGREMTIGTAPVTALRISYVGEYGWEIYTRAEFAADLWDTLWEAGQAHNMVMVGAGAFDSLRIEKGYRLWGADIHTDYNPYEAGIGWAVKLKKDNDFIGKTAAAAARQNVTRKLCCMTLEAPAVLLGKEPITKDGAKVGYVTSANFGYSVGKMIAYGYLPAEYAEPGTTVDIIYFDEPFTATVTEEPLYDPDMLCLEDAAPATVATATLEPAPGD